MSNRNKVELCVETVTFPLELDPFIGQSPTENIAGEDKSLNNDGSETDIYAGGEIGKVCQFLVSVFIFTLSIYFPYLFSIFLAQRWAQVARQHFGETPTNYQSKIDEFYTHLKTIGTTNKDGKQNSALLQNIPDTNTDSISSYKYISDKTIYGGHDEGNKTVVKSAEYSESVRQFLLKFLRAGNHDVDCATKILVNYLQTMKNHPKHYQSLTRQGKKS